MRDFFWTLIPLLLWTSIFMGRKKEKCRGSSSIVYRPMRLAQWEKHNWQFALMTWAWKFLWRVVSKDEKLSSRAGRPKKAAKKASFYSRKSNFSTFFFSLFYIIMCKVTAACAANARYDRAPFAVPCGWAESIKFHCCTSKIRTIIWPRALCTWGGIESVLQQWCCLPCLFTFNVCSLSQKYLIATQFSGHFVKIQKFKNILWSRTSRQQKYNNRDSPVIKIDNLINTCACDRQRAGPGP
jgi:hypothetical protein